MKENTRTYVVVRSSGIRGEQQQNHLTVHYARRFSFHFVIAVIAYFCALGFVFPKRVAPLSAFHSDIYGQVNAIPIVGGLIHAFTLPRPVGVALSQIFGRLGLEGLMAIQISYTVALLALSMTLCESFLMKRMIPWWIAFLTFVVAMSAPSFYFSAGYDPGNLAFFVAMLGVFVWESRSNVIFAWLLAVVLFTASALIKENVLPALAVYAFVVAFRDGRASGARAFVIVAMPFVAAAIAFGYERAIHSPFTNVGNAQDNPYAVNLHPESILAGIRYYISPLWNLSFVALLFNCLLGVWLNRRLGIAAFVVLAALALYVPYVILPNHLLGYYFWVPWPLLMLLIPLAWTPKSYHKTSLVA